MSDTIQILIATDNHVGYAERDPIRGDDSWKTFDEIMCLAKERDVDMVLLGGDLFHENKPSRKSMYNVMRSLRLNCFGDKPCELELLSDSSLHSDPIIGHANYEDPDINVAIPVFSIHGNHDDPSGDGLYAALDILEMAGLINYFGRVPQSDNIEVNPLLFQKGSTKLALYGLSNVRDERLHRTFRDGKVRFTRPGTQTSDWFNLMCVHQNHTSHTETSYLPENQLPHYMDFIVWGHEHNCDTIPHQNPETGFRVLQPGSSIATSLIAGEATPKHAFILNITGRETKLEHIRLRTVRPFVYKDLVLNEDKEAMRIAKRNDHRSELTRYLEKIVNGLIAQARVEWEEVQGERGQPEGSQEPDFPLPIIRLRLETTPPAGSAIRFDIENPQRFSNRFTDQVANRNDVLQLHVRKRGNAGRAAANVALDAETLARYQSGTIDINKLVDDFLSAQSLAILPTNYFSEAVHEYIQKDDKHAMEMFVNDSLANQIKHLVTLHEDEDDSDVADDLAAQIESYRSKLEELYSKGQMKKYGKSRYRPKPDGWDSDWDGPWEDQPAALIRDDEDENDQSEDMNEGSPAPSRAGPSTRGRGRGRGRATTATTTFKRGGGRAGAKSGGPTSRARKTAVVEEDDDDDDDDDDEDGDVVMIASDGDQDDSQALFFPEKEIRSRAATKARATASTKKTTSKPVATSKAKQSTLSFSQQPRTNGSTKVARQVVDDIEDSDEDDAFESLPATRTSRK